MNIENLKIIVQKLRELPEDYEHFTMREFYQYKISCNNVETFSLPQILNGAINLNDCGTSACVVGHMASWFPQEAKGSGWWMNLSERVTELKSDSNECEYMFSGLWHPYEPHHYQAADRIQRIIDGFVPERKELPWIKGRDVE